jgi:hypothetical protein
VSVTLNSTVNVFNQQDIRVVLIQNFAWPTALYLNRPNIFAVIILGTMMKPLPHSRRERMEMDRSSQFAVNERPGATS